MRSIISFLSSEDAATAVEYAVMLASIIVVAVASIAALGTQTGIMYADVNSEMESHGIK
jgi:Flp pilus assembly pilin Flp